MSDNATPEPDQRDACHRDALNIEKRKTAIKKLANQLDIPAEVLLGVADISHWDFGSLRDVLAFAQERGMLDPEED